MIYVDVKEKVVLQNTKVEVQRLKRVKIYRVTHPIKNAAKLFDFRSTNDQNIVAGIKKSIRNKSSKYRHKTFVQFRITIFVSKQTCTCNLGAPSCATLVIFWLHQ